MDRKSFLLNMRTNGLLKGLKPCFVIVKPEENGVVKANGQFVMSFRDTTLYFQKISRLFGMLKPQGDFKINVKEFVCYKFENKRVRRVFTLYKTDGTRISIEYMIGTKETFSTEDNMERISKELEALGIKKMELDKNV